MRFFNNYLRDPKRPQLPEHPSAKAGGAGPSRKEEPPAPFHGAPYGQAGPPPPHQYVQAGTVPQSLLQYRKHQPAGTETSQILRVTSVIPLTETVGESEAHSFKN